MLSTLLFATVVGHAEPGGARGGFGIDFSLGRAVATNGALDLGEIRLGGSLARTRPSGTWFDTVFHVAVMYGLSRGETDHWVTGLTALGLTALLHYESLRVGLGTSIGVLGVDEAGNRGPTRVLTGGEFGLGVEPFTREHGTSFFDVRGQLRVWGRDLLPGVTIALGARF